MYKSYQDGEKMLLRIFKLLFGISILFSITACAGAMSSKPKPEFVYEDGIKRKCLFWGPGDKCMHAVPTDDSPFRFKTN